MKKDLKQRISPGKDGLPVAKKWLDTINLSIRIGSIPEWTKVTVVEREDEIVDKNDIVTKKVKYEIHSKHSTCTTSDVGVHKS